MQALTAGTKKPGSYMPGFLAAVSPGISAILIASLVQGQPLDAELDSLDVGVYEGLSGHESRAEVAHGRDVVGVHADEHTRGESAVQLALSGGNLRSSIRPGSGEVNHATAGRLDSLSSRRAGIVRQHKRGTLGVQVGVTVLDEGQSGTDVAKSKGHIGGGCKENIGHFWVSFRDVRGIQRLNCLYNTTLSGEVNTFVVKSLQTVCLLFALGGGGCLRRAHVSNIPH